MDNEAPTPRAELREALITAAMRAAAGGGYPAVKARDLAREVGCAVGSIYNVFPDIDALVLTVKSRMLDALEAEVERALGTFSPQGSDAAGARFLALGALYLDFAARNWRLWSAMFEHHSAESEALDAYMTRLDVILTNIEQPLGALLPDLEETQRAPLARTLFAAVHGVVSLGLDGRLGHMPVAELHAQVRLFLDATLQGLRSAAPGS